MSGNILYNVNICSITQIPSPREIRAAMPQSPGTQASVISARSDTERILDREDPRKLMIVGPCSIHDLEAAREYAHRLRELGEELSESMRILMRVYFEKPRTSLGWKGFINDPFLDNSFRIDEGLRRARGFLLEVAEMGLGAATETLDPLTPQYIGDLISWMAIGARTSESQTHREIASGLSTPIGFKNPTNGNILAAVNAVKAVLNPHHFLGVTEDGLPAVFGTTGNPYAHVVLRGGAEPNYDAENVRACEAALAAAGLSPRIMIDCSHGNSEKSPDRQAQVLDDVLSQVEAGNRSIIGCMIESNLEGGSQRISSNRAALRYGVSITDACIDWKTTEEILRDAHRRLRAVLLR